MTLPVPGAHRMPVYQGTEVPADGDFLLVFIDNPDSLVIQYYGYGF